MRKQGLLPAYFGAAEEDLDQLGQLEQTANGVITLEPYPGPFGMSYRILKSLWYPLNHTSQAKYSIYVNNHLAISQAEDTCSLGHRRICFFFTPDANEVGGPMLERVEAFQKEVSATGADVVGTVKHIPAKDNAVEAGVKAALEVLSSPERPTAILTCHDLYGIGVLEAARRLDIKVPKELSVVGIDDIDWALIPIRRLRPSRSQRRAGHGCLRCL